jgi:hypothetical protein
MYIFITKYAHSPKIKFVKFQFAPKLILGPVYSIWRRVTQQDELLGKGKIPAII